ncbi:hypothetical protein TCAL_02077 [Tigriopus californicus]|uniref:Thymidylate kinase n=1 Tax=Tigriopus californicus TaxID=6832 RepID=A0A553NF38_TIGCA|nr:thymidylate kinase-like [Tigriopus californicus]TRY63989.1 hypothetical protein TCAL_02077 [Tigriopus californicus]|eukprot:TCALIF_02077-PA protein Name:"Similar to DTYMK Thymidylate kinase (Homo sapiens)" AED:0.01 eAED:0.01 QI:0/-1/0/1/-1/1/1/0/219
MARLHGARTTGRGLLIVFEGCDRSGKTTHCTRLVSELNARFTAQFMRFPDRSTLVGRMIDAYLKGEKELDDHAIHLLFSTNRWEKVDELKRALENGSHVVVDRYAFSGVAFSAAKDGMSMQWCKQPDRGLPRPDLVCFLDVSPDEAQKRGGFGRERYEKLEFQARVRQNYDHLMDDTWQIIQTDHKTMDQVYAEVMAVVERTMQSQINQKPLTPLWPMD